MQTKFIRFTSIFPFPSKTVFQFFFTSSAFERMIPPWEQVICLSKSIDPSQVGSIIELKIKVGPFWKNWVIEHNEFKEGESFTDVQLKGPFAFWKHKHIVHPKAENTCELEDQIEFSSPLGFFSTAIEKKILKILRWQHETLLNDLKVQFRYSKTAFRILVSGSSGMVGSSLLAFLRSSGHQVFRLARGRKEAGQDVIFWDPEKGIFKKENFENFDAVIHLAGKNIGSQFWTKAFKNLLFKSRCRDSWLLSQILSKITHPPQVVIFASAIGIYGDRKEEILIEESHLGKGFLANLCQKWEDTTQSLENKGIRAVHTRFGIILSTKGGALKRMQLPFRLGMGAIIGKGTQWISWIALEDVIYAIYHVLHTKTLTGSINFTSPFPETNQSMSQKLAKSLHRPLFFRIPEKFLHFTIGEMAQEMFLTSEKAFPKKLEDSGYTFFYPTLETVLKRHFF